MLLMEAFGSGLLGLALAGRLCARSGSGCLFQNGAGQRSGGALFGAYLTHMSLGPGHNSLARRCWAP
ncbi:hypothetical protein ACFSNO_25935 [Streptomyces cirratus]